ncbi:MAG: class I SAM-dependent methyltransferase [Actinobacteria bacterium]|nr:class I SAM-dependent methyltransferase [Actinomycetota bacterium]
MAGVVSNEEYWHRRELVELYRGLDGALDYELDAVRDASIRAGATGRVHDVHVIGAGVGRELADIRRLTSPARIHAWDMSAPMVEACQARIDQAGWDDVTVRLATIQEIAGRIDRPADLVVGLSAVLCYEPDVAGRHRNLRSLHDMCRPGAGLAVVVQQQRGRRAWGPYFALMSLLEHTPLRDRGVGNRPSRYGDAAVLLHHYGRRELRDLLQQEGFDACSIESLREWAGPRNRQVPRRSPNPLVATATRR